MAVLDATLPTVQGLCTLQYKYMRTVLPTVHLQEPLVVAE